MGLALYPENALSGLHIEVRLGQQPFELGVLAFELAQPPGVGHVHGAVLGTPLVEGGVAEAALAAHVLDRHAGLDLHEEPDGLFLAVFAVSHVRHSPS